MKKNKKFYITTAIDYVNSLPHIGTAYEKIGADVLARFKRMQGYDVHFQMGNDEHSTNVAKASASAGLDPATYCNQMRKKFEEVWKKLNISYDGFIQTSESRHVAGVQKLFSAIHANGDIYKKPYEGWYCESCEAFYTEKDLVEGVCPNHKVKPTWLKEENYFFRLTKYQDKLYQHIQAHPEFILPEMRRNEILKVIEGGLQDVSVSRASQKWGIPVPFDQDHVVYVWFDALINYITAVGFGKDAKTFKKWWPADYHVIGKDITRFHCVIWPAMLMSAKLPLPKSIFGHGFVYLKGEKMSKTLGNVVTPLDVVDVYGADALRYYLLRTSGFGQDSDFTWDDFTRRYNGDLANGLGNLVSRTLGMVEQYLDGNLPGFSRKKRKVSDAFSGGSGDIEFHTALASLWDEITTADRYINDHKPWELAKKKDTKKVQEVLYHVVGMIETITASLHPFLPSTAEKISKQFGFGITKTHKIQKGENLFPRIEEKKEEKTMEPTTTTMDNTIDIADFAKVDLRVAEILTAEKVEGTDRLLKLQVNLGDTGTRQIVAGIAQHYTPEALIGKKIVVVANLKPAKLRGVESQGMLLAASDGQTISILTPLKDVPPGSKVK